MILFRTRDLRPVHRRFAEQLASCGMPLAVVVDERNGLIDTAPFPKVSFTVPACEALGLYCPYDVTWRAGDYALYLARDQFPDVERFWMIEHDVRYGGNWPAFFARLDHSEADFLAAEVCEADRDWFWEFTMTARDQTVWRCMFPVVRLTREAIDVLRTLRVAMSRNAWRRRDWPNDEAFVATVLVNSRGLHCEDFNDFDRALYDSETFGFYRAMDGDTLQMRDGMLYHPVLYGAEYTAKVARHAGPEHHSLLVRRIRRRLVRAINKRLTP